MRIGVDIGGTNVAIGLLDDKFNIVSRVSIKTVVSRGCKSVVENIVNCIKDLCAEANLKLYQIESIGIGCPGRVDSEAQMLIYANNIPERNVPFCKLISEHMPRNVRVYIENDARCAALGESHFGVTKGADNSVLVTLGTGIGGGVMINGKVHKAKGGLGPEIGHMVIHTGGRECSCGRRGCWEAYASGTALINMTRAAIVSRPDSLINSLIGGDFSAISCKHPFIAARNGDSVAKHIVSQYIEYLAEGLANVANIFMPDIIAIGGGISNEGAYLIDPAVELAKKMMYSKNDSNCIIKKASLGNKAGTIGAALLPIS